MSVVRRVRGLLRLMWTTKRLCDQYSSYVNNELHINCKISMYSHRYRITQTHRHTQHPCIRTHIYILEQHKICFLSAAQSNKIKCFVHMCSSWYEAYCNNIYILIIYIWNFCICVRACIWRTLLRWLFCFHTVLLFFCVIFLISVVYWSRI